MLCGGVGKPHGFSEILDVSEHGLKAKTNFWSDMDLAGLSGQTTRQQDRLFGPDT